MALPAQAFAHTPFIDGDNGRLPLLLGALLLFVMWVGYCLGARRATPTLNRLLTFQAATLIAMFTVFGPLDELAESSTAMHMIQHMLMMTVIPVLWVLARPLPQWTAAGGRRIVRLWTLLLRIARRPMLAACIHGAVVWFWHSPKPYVLALENAWWHAAEHAGFLLSAGLLWWSVLHCNQRTAPHAFLALLFTLMHTGLLGALLTFANSSLYGADRELQSQQLAGLIMWVLGGIPYFAAAAWCGLRWFRQISGGTGTASTVDSIQ